MKRQSKLIIIIPNMTTQNLNFIIIVLLATVAFGCLLSVADSTNSTTKTTTKLPTKLTTKLATTKKATTKPTPSTTQLPAQLEIGFVVLNVTFAALNETATTAINACVRNQSSTQPIINVSLLIPDVLISF